MGQSQKNKSSDISFIQEYCTQRGFRYDERHLIEQVSRGLHRVILTLIDFEDRKYIFKYLLTREKQHIDWFRAEIRALNYFAKFPQNPFFTNRIIDTGQKPNLWMLVDFLPGKVLGNTFEFDNKYLNKNFAKFLIGCVRVIQGLPAKRPMEGCFEVETKKVHRTLARLADCGPVKKHLGKINTAFHDLRNEYADTTRYRFAHGDLTPLNILLDNGKYGILDWEVSYFTTPVHDLSYLFHRTWRNYSWQKDFRKMIFEFILSPKDSKIFDFNLIILLSYDSYAVNNALESNNLKLFHNKNFSRGYLEGLYKTYQTKLSEVIELL